MTDVRIPCLSLWQPWASLMAIGAKRVETRGYRPRLGIGQRFLIHAAKHWSRQTKAICTAPYFREALSAAGFESWRDLPTGAIIAAATLVGAERVGISRNVVVPYFGRVPFPPPYPERAFGDYSTNRRWGWFTADLRRLSVPVPWSGLQGIFYVPTSAVAPFLSRRPTSAPVRTRDLFDP